jgi:hypothetical protein
MANRAFLLRALQPRAHPSDTLGRVITRTHTVNGIGVYSLALTYDLADAVNQEVEAKAGISHTYDY